MQQHRLHKAPWRIVSGSMYGLIVTHSFLTLDTSSAFCTTRLCSAPYPRWTVPNQHVCSWYGRARAHVLTYVHTCGRLQRDPRGSELWARATPAYPQTLPQAWCLEISAELKCFPRRRRVHQRNEPSNYRISDVFRILLTSTCPPLHWEHDAAFSVFSVFPWFRGDVRGFCWVSRFGG